MNSDWERENALCRAREKVGEAVEELEEVLPDTAEELSWIWENLREEIRAQRAVSEAREGAGQ